jgi:DNA-binding NarL/FixJ family response regulator
MRENRLQVLIVDGDPDRVQLLEEAFGEMEEFRYSKPAMPACTRDYALDWREAIDRCAGQTSPPDAILLNVSHECTPSAEVALAAIRAASPSSAVVVLTARDDEALALGLIRLGAQDYLIETEIDCAPLGRTLRCAVERSRLNWSRQCIEMVDDLTGLYNRRGVELLGEREDRLAAALDLRRWSVELRMDPPASPDSRDEDLYRLELAEQLNELTAAGLLAGRAANNAFVLFGLAPSAPAADAYAAQTAHKLVTQCAARGIPVSVRVATGGNASLLPL